MKRPNSQEQQKRGPLPEPEYFDEMFPEIQDMPDPWEDGAAAPKPEQHQSESAGAEANRSPSDSHDPGTAPETPQPPVTAAKKGSTEPASKLPAAEKSGHSRKQPAATGVTLPHTARPTYPGKQSGFRQPKEKLPPLPELPGPQPAENPPKNAPRPQFGIRTPRIGVRPGQIEADGKLPGFQYPGIKPADAALDWPKTEESAPSQPAPEKPQWYVLGEVIENHQPLPENALILGVDQDGKPLVLSLEEASPGGILIVGDSSLDNRKHLQAILSSAGLLNNPKQVSMDVISPETAYFTKKGPLQGKVCQPDDDSVYELLGDYLETLEKRAGRNGPFPIRILVLDQVEQLAENLASESLSYLRWILRRGPQSGIWPIATLASACLAGFDLKTYRSFGLRLCGKMTDPAIAERYSNISGKILKKLLPGSQACLKIDEDVIQFSIPHF